MPPGNRAVPGLGVAGDLEHVARFPTAAQPARLGFGQHVVHGVAGVRGQHDVIGVPGQHLLVADLGPVGIGDLGRRVDAARHADHVRLVHGVAGGGEEVRVAGQVDAGGSRRRPGYRPAAAPAPLRSPKAPGRGPGLLVAAPIRVTASFSRVWSSGLTRSAGMPSSARLSAALSSLRGRMTRSGARGGAALQGQTPWRCPRWAAPAAPAR